MRSNIDVTIEAAQDILDINEGILYSDWPLTEKKSHVRINVGHLNQVKNNQFGDLDQFSVEQISKIDQAIAVGNAYVSSI